MNLRSVCLLSLALLAPAAGAAELLVGNKSGDSVWRLSTEDGRKRGEFAVGPAPHEIAVSSDGALALVSNYGGATPGRTLSVLDLRAGKLLRVIDLGEHGRPHGLRFLPGDRRAVATTEASGRLVLVDIAAGKVEDAIALGPGRGHMVALSADGRTAYVTKIDAGTLSRVDLEARRKSGERAAGAGAEGVAVHPRSGEVWVSNREAGTVTVHDPDTLEIRATIPSPGFPIRVTFTPDGRHALVTNARAATLGVIDAAARRSLHAIALAKPGVEYRETLLGRAALPIGVTADPARPRVYVAISGGDEIAVIDTTRWTVAERWASGREPDALGIVAR
ncbi:YncE family protein [Vulcaniibacterium tengchongense]|uniref:DNA-binding beta-propeller fold protein YncE n=1 Tax=Vulcaniibacterium tengchongense TaxID=1273429 RepID=A0A3N4VIC1_9GAMM|nr:gluconolaconase [Vulcaniibacterium tengchongense]RPE81245.1 DNA-binding beta-propeller fold protein YncE [Vulcaniibacterium tengchongense]